MTLSTIERVLFLRGIELFSQIPSEELVPVAQVAQEISFRAGETFIKQGDIGDCLYIIVDGKVDIVIEGLGQVTQRQPKDIIGEMAVISSSPRSAHCIAAADITVLKIEQDDFWELLGEKSELALGVIKVLGLLFNEAAEQLRRLGSEIHDEK